jgi:tetratricopeptide (TPR) repeat protein
MLTPVAPTDDPDGKVALGVFVSRHEGAMYFGHDGADEGFQAMLLASAEKGYGVAMMANSDEGIPLMREVLDAVATEYGWEGFGKPLKLATLAPARLAELAGAYQVNVDRAYHVAVDGDHLVLRAPFQPPVALLPISDTTFVRRDDDARYTFSKAADGSFQVTTAPTNGEWPAGKRVADTVSLGLDDVAAGRIDQAVQWYRAESLKAPHDPALGEDRLNNLGFEAVRRGDLPGALLILRANVARFPDAMNPYDSLAYVYQHSGDRAQAMATYEKSLAAFARDTTTPASFKEALRKNALTELKKLGALAR